MKKVNLLLLSVLFLTGCNYEPLFFTGKVATDEEVLNFFSNVNEGYAFIPDGWYEFDRVYITSNGKYKNTSKFIVEIESYKNEQNRWEYKFKQLQGEAFYQRDNITKYFYATNGILIIDTIYENGDREVIGNHVEFSIRSKIFNFGDRILSWTHYLKNNSIHATGKNYLSEWHIGIEYSDDFKNIVNGKEYTEAYVTSGTEYKTITYKSCEPIDISVDMDYELGFELESKYNTPYSISLLT